MVDEVLTTKTPSSWFAAIVLLIRVRLVSAVPWLSTLNPRSVLASTVLLSNARSNSNSPALPLLTIRTPSPVFWKTLFSEKNKVLNPPPSILIPPEVPRAPALVPFPIISFRKKDPSPDDGMSIPYKPLKLIRLSATSRPLKLAPRLIPLAPLFTISFSVISPLTTLKSDIVLKISAVTIPSRLLSLISF